MMIPFKIMDWEGKITSTLLSDVTGTGHTESGWKIQEGAVNIGNGNIVNGNIVFILTL